MIIPVMYQRVDDVIEASGTPAGRQLRLLRMAHQISEGDLRAEIAAQARELVEQFVIERLSATSNARRRGEQLKPGD